MLLWPFSKKMYGVGLLHVHGMEWKKTYESSPISNVERVIIVLALLVLASDLITALQAGQITIPCILANAPLEVCLVLSSLILLYLALLAFYGFLLLVLIIALIRHTLLERQHESTDKVPQDNLPFELSRQPKSSLLITSGLAVMSMVLPLCLLGAIDTPLDNTLELAIKQSIIPFVVTLVPYVWGFRKATNIGILAGMYGTAIGLWLFIRLTGLSWWDNAIQIGLLNVLSNASGWLGGAVGQGQIRESVAAVMMEIDIANQGFRTATQTMFEIASKTIKEHMRTATGRLPHLRNDRGSFATAYATSQQDGFSLIAYRRDADWVVGHRPMLNAFKWAFERHHCPRSANQIVDKIFNFWQSQVIRLVLLKPERGSESPNSPHCLQIILLNYRETPSILWIDDSTIGSARQLYEKLMNAFGKEFACSIGTSTQVMILVNWTTSPRLEQYGKCTLVARGCSTQDISDLKLNADVHVPNCVLQEFLGTPSFWSKLRGRTSTFLIFLMGQVILAVLINLASDMLGTMVFR